jgi:DHA1 family quinolone resistance protein-like MFS transporter
MNRVTKLLLISDIFLVSGFGLIEPILSIFIKDSLLGGEIYAAGFASMLFLLTKSFIQLPFSKFVDKHDHNIRWLILGTVCTAMVPFFYIFATRVEHIYVAQVLYGIGAGLAYPTWLGLWSTHLDRHHESYEWSLYSTLTGLGTAGAAAIGAVLVQWIGFRPTFSIVGLFALSGCFVLFFLQSQEQKKRLYLRVPKKR